MKVYLNGQFVDSDSACLSAFDAAVQHGVGLFTTMRAYNGRIFRLQSHLDRLAHSVMQLGLYNQLDTAPLGRLVQRTLAENQLADARIRLTITGGDLALLNAARGQGKPHTPTILIQVTAPTVYPQELFTQGATATVAEARANPLDPTAGHKTINYWMRLQSLMKAGAAGASEALWFAVNGDLCGGAVSNAFVVKDGQLLTPIARGEESPEALPAPVLPGITRQAVIETAESLGLAVEKQALNGEDVARADELFLTNSSWLILPVVRVNQQAIADGQVGRLTGLLYDRMLEQIAAECGGSKEA